MRTDLKKVKAIEAKNKKILLEVNNLLDEDSGIYFLTREDEVGIKYAYIGQAKHLLTRLAQHMSGWQHIDLSIKKHGFATQSKYGWRIGFVKCPVDDLDAQEQHYIKLYATKGYQLRNKTAGGQNAGKTQINAYREPKGYRDGIQQGKKMLARELNHIIDNHLAVGLKEGKENNKISQKAFEKFHSLLDENTYKGA